MKHRFSNIYKKKIICLLFIILVVQSIKIYTCNWYDAHTYDRVELKMENSKSQCNTNQLSNGENLDHGDEDIFDNNASLGDCFEWPIDDVNSTISVTVSKWGTDDWGFCWAKIFTSDSKMYYYCKNPNDYHMSTGYPLTIKMECWPYSFLI